MYGVPLAFAFELLAASFGESFQGSFSSESVFGSDPQMAQRWPYSAYTAFLILAHRDEVKRLLKLLPAEITGMGSTVSLKASIFERGYSATPAPTTVI